MQKDVWALRAVETAFTGGFVALAFAAATAGLGAQACDTFTSWWASWTDGMFTVEIYEITTELPHLDRGDLPLPPTEQADVPLEMP